MGVAAALLTGGDALTALDVAAVGVMGFLVFGRLGCLAVGCCHGKPRTGGVVYGPEHVEEGFPEELAGGARRSTSNSTSKTVKYSGMPASAVEHEVRRTVPGTAGMVSAPDMVTAGLGTRSTTRSHS